MGAFTWAVAEWSSGAGEDLTIRHTIRALRAIAHHIIVPLRVIALPRRATGHPAIHLRAAVRLDNGHRDRVVQQRCQPTTLNGNRIQLAGKLPVQEGWEIRTRHEVGVQVPRPRARHRQRPAPESWAIDRIRERWAIDLPQAM